MIGNTFDGEVEEAESLRIDRAKPVSNTGGCKKVILPPDEPTPEVRSTFHALRICVLAEITIPISPGTDRQVLESDVVDALATIVVPRVPYLTSLTLAHSHECETDFTGGIQTIVANQADRSAAPSPAGLD